MIQNAEKNGVPMLATTSDSRVTRVGRFLRKCRLDEIPQLINILAGDMSIVGPRPERPKFVNEFIKNNPGHERTALPRILSKMLQKTIQSKMEN